VQIVKAQRRWRAKLVCHCSKQTFFGRAGGRYVPFSSFWGCCSNDQSRLSIWHVTWYMRLLWESFGMSYELLGLVTNTMTTTFWVLAMP
jgi:hypothetical protein